LKKYQSNHFYFTEEGPGRGSEATKKECNVNCFDFIFFSVFLMDIIEWKNYNRLKRNALKKKTKKHMHTRKELETH